MICLWLIAFDRATSWVAIISLILDAGDISSAYSGPYWLTGLGPRFFSRDAPIVLEGKSGGDVVGALIHYAPRIVTLCVTWVATTIMGGCRLSWLSVNLMNILFQSIGNFCLLLLFSSVLTIIRVTTLPAISTLIFICHAILVPTSGL